MKALTLTQPYATLVILGAKTWETRSWFTRYRGPLIIHSAKGFPRWAKDCCFETPFREALVPWLATTPYPELTLLSDLPTGCCLGTVQVSDCLSTEVALSRLHISETEMDFGDWAPGRYAWRLNNPRHFREPVPMKGALGLWECDVLLERNEELMR